MPNIPNHSESPIDAQYHEIERLIEESGKIARDYYFSTDDSNTIKDDKSVVTRIDSEIEDVLVSYIKEHFPHDAIQGEERGASAGDSGFTWHIDPIDGTDNFLRRIPFCSISVARLGPAEESFGIVHNPIQNQTISSIGDSQGGVYENNNIKHLTASSLGGRYVISICPGRTADWMKPARYALMSALGIKYGKSSSYGSWALELAYIAANRIDAALVFGLYSYDYAAGLFLARSAGASISVFEGGEWQLWTGSMYDLSAKHFRTLLVSHPDIHPDLVNDIGNPEDWAGKAVTFL